MIKPEANITIIHAGPLPLNDSFSDFFRQKVISTLKEFNVDILLNEKVDLNAIGESGEAKLLSGKTLSADMIVLLR